MNKSKINSISNKIIGCAIEVHKNLGPGLLESTYSQCLAYELNTSGINFKLEYPIPVKYKNINIDCSYRADFIVEDEIIVEIKSVKELLPIHEAQLLTYLKISDKRLGLLINFNVKLLKKGLKRFVNKLYIFTLFAVQKPWRSGWVTTINLCVLCALCGAQITSK